MSVNEKMTAIADAIRDKTGGTEKLTLDDMPKAIAEIAGYNEGYNKGVAEIEAKYVWVSYLANLNTAFYSVEFPANTELTINNGHKVEKVIRGSIDEIAPFETVILKLKKN